MKVKILRIIDDMYDYVDGKYHDGCGHCPFTEECDQGGGYTAMDEYGKCPVKDIETKQDFEDAKFPTDED